MHITSICCFHFHTVYVAFNLVAAVVVVVDGGVEGGVSDDHSIL